MHRIRGNLTYSNVVSTLCLVLLLAGGTAYAAKTMLPKNSVGTKQIKNNAVSGAKIKNGAVTASKIAPGAISIDPASVGTVPSAKQASNADHATTADNATTLQGLTPPQIAAASKVRCPAETLPAGGLCIEEAELASATFFEASTQCAKAGRTLPTVAQIETFDERYPGDTSTFEWAGQAFLNGSTFEAIEVTRLSNGGFNLAVAAVSATREFRCGVEASN